MSTAGLSVDQAHPALLEELRVRTRVERPPATDR